jgi:hypothetical protein
MAVGSIRGFRCRWCEAEVLIQSRQPGISGRVEWATPIICCGELLQPLETGHVLSAWLPRRRLARCDWCGVEVYIVMQPERALVCTLCRADLVNVVRSLAPRGPATGRIPGGGGGGETALRDHDGLTIWGADLRNAVDRGPQGRRTGWGRRRREGS